ncbi:uncharacterized protein [Arachis hypogaea]|uniref:uncharacterized protein n=1 Tax=Arachis hypogaea TaxID=3818 RepID=UPI003B212DE7
MDLLRRPNANMALLLLSIIFIKTCNNHNYLALASPSGGVMGGSFFDDSDSSSSQSSLNDHSHYQHYDSSQPSVDDNTPSNNDDGGVPSVFMFFMFGLVLVGLCKHRNGNAISVIKVQVAMLGGKKGSSIQRDLTRIAQAADTSSPEETILALHQNPGYCISGYSYVDLKLSREDGEKCYTQLSHEERAKFDKETLVNFNGKEKISTRNQSANVFVNDDEYTLLDEEKKPEEEKKLLLNGFGNEFIVVCILWPLFSFSFRRFGSSPRNHFVHLVAVIPTQPKPPPDAPPRAAARRCHDQVDLSFRFHP